MNKEIINLLYDIEEKINIEKMWIEIANLVYENGDNLDTKLLLILECLNKQNKEIYINY